MLLVYILVIIAASFVLIKAVNLFIEASSKMAQHLNISAYTISFFLVAIATSLPETVVGITSAVERNPILSYGNVIGSNIALMTLVIAIPILIGTSLSTRAILNSKDIYITVIFALLPIALIIDGDLTRVDGLILLTAYIVYGISVFRQSSKIEKFIEKFDSVNMWKQGAIFVISLVLLLASSEAIVKAAVLISKDMGLSLTFIGLTITALGTSLPEIAFAIGAIKGRHQQEILGNIIGSVVANSTMVLGITAVIHPIVITPVNNAKLSSMIFVVITLILFVNFSRSQEKITKIEAMFLLFLYIVFIAMEYYLSGIGLK